MSYVMQRLAGNMIECEESNGYLSVYVNGRCVSGGRRLAFAAGVVFGLAVAMLTGCSAPPESEEPTKPEQSTVTFRPNADYRTSSAWYYCDKDDEDPAFVMLSRAPVIDGKVQTITHTRLWLDWMEDCEVAASEWHKELDNREVWHD